MSKISFCLRGGGGAICDFFYVGNFDIVASDSVFVENCASGGVNFGSGNGLTMAFVKLCFFPFLVMGF